MSNPALARLPVRHNIKRRLGQQTKWSAISTCSSSTYSDAPKRAFSSFRHRSRYSSRYFSEMMRRGSLHKRRTDLDFCSCRTAPDFTIVVRFLSWQNMQSRSGDILSTIYYSRNLSESRCYRQLRFAAEKSGETYHQLIDEILKVAPNWSPESVMMDFVQASINAFGRKFPNVVLSGRYFYLRRSIHPQLQVR